MQQIFGSRPDVKGCSRTDAGVHAEDFCLSFKHRTTIPMKRLPLALNKHLPKDIRVYSAHTMAPNFHARYNCLSKEYHYHIRNAVIDCPFTDRYYYRYSPPLNVAAMQQAAQHLIGRHHFASFCSRYTPGQDAVREIQSLTVTRHGDMVTLAVTGDGFLYNMVRIIAGTLLQVGSGDLSPAQIPAILAAQDRRQAGPTLHANGLFLHAVRYADGDFMNEETR